MRKENKTNKKPLRAQGLRKRYIACANIPLAIYHKILFSAIKRKEHHGRQKNGITKNRGKCKVFKNACYFSKSLFSFGCEC